MTTKANGKVVASVGFARSCESFAVGEAPHAVRLWRAGWNATDKGSVNFTPRSADLIMADHARRGNPLVFDYEHESLLPLEKRGGSPMRGVASAPSAEPEIRNDANGQPELWAKDVGWTDEAKRQIQSGERRQVSPVCDFDLETGEVLNLKNVALCREGATHSGTLLASVAKGTSTMDELIQAICDAAAAMDFEKVETLAQQAEAGGSPGLARMARAMAKPAAGPPPAASAPPVPPQHAPPPAAMAAYSRDLAAAHAKGDEAIKIANACRVENIIAMSRECFDAADEREHIDAANPEATRRFVASVKRKQTAGTIAATRAAESDARPPEGGAPPDPTFGLRADEIQMVHNMNNGKAETMPDGKGGTKPNPTYITLGDFAATKSRTESMAASRGKVS